MLYSINASKYEIIQDSEEANHCHLSSLICIKMWCAPLKCLLAFRCVSIISNGHKTFPHCVPRCLFNVGAWHERQASLCADSHADQCSRPTVAWPCVAGLLSQKCFGHFEPSGAKSASFIVMLQPIRLYLSRHQWAVGHCECHSHRFYAPILTSGDARGKKKKKKKNEKYKSSRPSSLQGLWKRGQLIAAKRAEPNAASVHQLPLTPLFHPSAGSHAEVPLESLSRLIIQVSRKSLNCRGNIAYWSDGEKK